VLKNFIYQPCFRSFMPRTIHRELHRNDRIGWLRAAVLGANDGIVSTASLMIGVAAASAGRDQLLIAGVAGLVAGAMSMAAGEYVSVSSQSDIEQSDLARERIELQVQPAAELRELASIYRARGLTTELAEEVALQLTAHDALGAHARDELGMTATSTARPLQAALASAASFTAGAALPLLTALLTPASYLVLVMGGTSLLFLVALGVLAARTGGAPVLKASIRIAFWGVLAMAISAGVGRLFGVVA
jgi:VIT1/CCC1 family predicted Fe2+/Mn2+ transporter